MRIIIENNFKGCYQLNCVPTNSYIEVLTPSVIVFGDRAFKEVKLNEVIRVALIQ